MENQMNNDELNANQKNNSEESNNSEETEYSDDSNHEMEFYNIKNAFKSFDELIQYNIDWINNKLSNNVISGALCFADDGQFHSEPVMVRKDLMIKLNKLGFLTSGSQSGINYNNIIERAYVEGYIHNDKVKQLHDNMNLNGKIFQYIPINKFLKYHNNCCQLGSQYYEIKAIGKLNENGKYDFCTRIGFDHSSPIHQCCEDTFNMDFINNYSICFAVDPVFGISFDDLENGLVIKLLHYLENQ